MNNKGQLGFLKILVFAILFIVFFAIALAPMVVTMLGISDLSQFGSLGQLIIGSFNVWILLGFVVLIFSAILIGLSNE